MTGITILDRANAPMGPFTRAQVAEKLQRGEVTLSSLAYIDGLAQWTPLRDVLARLDAANPPVAPVIAVPPVPAGPVAAPLASAPAYSFAATMEPPAHLVYAGFWLRVVAHLIDIVVLVIGFTVVCLVLGMLMSLVMAAMHSGNSSGAGETSPGAAVLLIGTDLILIAILLFGAWLYHALLESSAWQGTLGKLALGLRITSMTGERITFWHATGRFLARIIATLPFFGGYIMAAFTERKQALHDLIASTLVVRK